MTEVRIQIKNAQEIKRAFHKSPALMTKNLDTAIRKVVLFIRNRAVTNAPIRTGNLRASVYTDFQPLRGEIGFAAKYAAAVHDGSKAHVILPKNGKALFWKGASHPVRKVNHPGSRANPYLRRAVEENQFQIDKLFSEAVQDTLDQVAKEVN